jgi:hypothetical protein
VNDLETLSGVIAGARCWGIELDPRYRVLAVTVEPDPLRTPGTAGEHQLLCFPVSVLLVAVTRPIVEDGASRTALVTFDLEQLTAVSERFAGATIDTEPFGQPEPRPGTWGPRHSLEGRTSAADGTRSTLSLDLETEDGARFRLFARFDDAELRDGARTVIMSTSAPSSDSLLGSLASMASQAHRTDAVGTAVAGADGEAPDIDGGRDTDGSPDPLQF